MYTVNNKLFAINMDKVSFVSTIYDQKGTFKYLMVLVDGSGVNVNKLDEAQELVREFNRHHNAEVDIPVKEEVRLVLPDKNIAKPKLVLNQPLKGK